MNVVATVDDILASLVLPAVRGGAYSLRGIRVWLWIEKELELYSGQIQRALRVLESRGLVKCEKGRWKVVKKQTIMPSSTKGAKVGKKASKQDLSTYQGRVGAAVRARRVAIDMTVDDFRDKLAAAGFDVSTDTVYAWEQGRGKMPVDVLPAIADALSIKLKKLLPDQ